MDIILQYIYQLAASFIATVSFCVLFKVPLKQYVVCGLNGALGWLIYFALCEPLGMFVATFFGTVAIAIASRLLAIVRKTPVTLLLIPGMIPLVPGTAIYHTAYNFFVGAEEMFAKYAAETVKLAFAIVLGIVIVFAMPIKKYRFTPIKTDKK